MKKLLFYVFSSIITGWIIISPVNAESLINEKIQIFADQYNSENSSSYYSDYNDKYSVEFNKHKSDFLLYYGKYLSGRFLRENGDKSISVNEIYQYEKDALDSMDLMIDADKNTSIGFLEMVVGESSKPYIDEFIFRGDVDDYYGNGMYFYANSAKLFSNSYNVSNYDTLLENKKVDSVYVGYHVFQEQDTEKYNDEYYYSTNFTLGDLEHKNKLKTVYIPGDDFGEITFSKLEGANFDINIEDIVKEYDGESTIFSLRIYVKVGESYYSNSKLDYGYFNHTPIAKVIEAKREISSDYGYNDYEDFSNGIDNILEKIHKKQGDEKFKKTLLILQDKVSEVNQKLEDELQESILKIKTGDEFSKQKEKLKQKEELVRKLERLESIVTEKIKILFPESSIDGTIVEIIEEASNSNEE